MTPLRIDGRRIPCRACGRHDAKTDCGGVLLCTKCFRAFAIGYKVGKIAGRAGE